MKAPQDLASIQKWFISIIEKPLTENQELAPLTERGNLVKEESIVVIQPSKTMQPYERMQVYNQQYWWRFYSIMQDQYPFLVRLFGYGDFNRQLVIPYLKSYPSKHWSLKPLGINLVKWLKKNYFESDRKLVINSSQIDLAFHRGFFKKPLKNVGIENNYQASLFMCRFKLQPFVELHSFNGDYMSFRDEFLKQDPQYWIDHDFPILKKDRQYHYITYRAPDGHMYWEEISKAQFILLKTFKKGATLDEACLVLEDNQNYFEEAIGNIQHWFKKWSELNLLAIRKKDK
jgi:hypothetical protein